MLEKGFSLKGNWQQHATLEIKQLFQTLSPESKMRVAEQINARIELLGDKPINEELAQKIIARGNKIKNRKSLKKVSKKVK